LAWVDYNAPVHDVGDLRGFPAQSVERVRWQLLKLDGMRRELGPVAVAMQGAIKKALDPLGILNPGKLVG